ncbi:MAG: hypothetical protein Q9220_002243 [cf. Caloplaca sp. 1 TL-2023]
MTVFSKSPSFVSLPEHVDSTWQLVNVDTSTTTKSEGSRQRRLNNPRSALTLKARTNTMPNLPSTHRISPHNMDERPQSTWSDSDHSDDLTTSWVSRGSKILKKQNSKLTLNSNKSNAWIKEEYVPNWRSQNKHGRMWSTGSNISAKPAISRPYNFQHLTHTQACQFPEIHHASERQIRTDFSTARASQVPQRELQGIRAEDLRSPDSSMSMYDDPVTPPSYSPTKYRSRPGSVLSIRNPGTLSRSQSIDNFSQPSPRYYRVPPSPISPPPRTSSHTALASPPDFFSDHHHATPEERALLALGDQEMVESTRSNSISSEQMFDDPIVPHAITTPDDIACPLVPPLPRRSTLALADVPEEDELRSIRKTSFETPRPMTAESTLRHAQSFPANASSPHRRKLSGSRKALARPDSIPFAGPLFTEPMVIEEDISEHCNNTQRMSFGPRMIDANWEDIIDYSYKLEAEADCEFDWDRVSTMNDAHQPSEARRESDDSLTKEYAKLNTSQPLTRPGDATIHDAPRLQTSLPDLDFSATSSAKSSMASLRGPFTPHALPSPHHARPALQSSKSMDTLNLDSSFYIVHDTEMPEDHWQKEYDHASHFNYPFNNLNIVSPAKSTISASNRPSLTTHHSCESIVPSRVASAAQTRRNTSSSNGLPEVAGGEKKFRQHVDITTEEIASRVAVLSVANSSAIAPNGPEQMSSPTEPSSLDLFHSNLKQRSSDLSTSISRQSVKSQDPVASWPSPPRNILLVQKQNAPAATQALKDFAVHIHDTYPNINILFEPNTATELHESIHFGVYAPVDTTNNAVGTPSALTQKVDLTATFGGDGTILRASSLFSSTHDVPPILSFSMGTLGFLGEWKFAEFKRAFRQVYVSGAGAGDRSRILDTHHPNNTQQHHTSHTDHSDWSSIRGKNLGTTRSARVLLRNRLKVAVHPTSPSSSTPPTPIHAMNEIIIHRGATPHLAHITILINNRPLTEAVADGMIISTPTGSTAYSLSAGGSIIHPLVDSLCLTPICPRSLSFRPLVLPARTPVTLQLSSRNNRGREVEVSIDGVRQREGLRVGGEIRVVGEQIQRGGKEGWRGGVPCVMRSGEGGGRGGDGREDDGWVGGLNGLLKFNYPFGEEG